MAQASPSGGTGDVSTDGAPPATGTVRDLITGPVVGTFAAVTSQSGSVGYTAIYKQDNSAVQLETGPGTGNGAVTALETDQGRIACEKVVIAAGQWSREIGRLAGVNIPLGPVFVGAEGNATKGFNDISWEYATYWPG